MAGYLLGDQTKIVLKNIKPCFVSFALNTISLVVPPNSIVAKSYHAEKLCNFFIVIMTVFKSAKSFSSP